MIGIRSITYHLPAEKQDNCIQKIARLSWDWEKDQFGIRTQRICFMPLSAPEKQDIFRAASELCSISSVRWFGVPLNPFDCQCSSEMFSFASDLLAEYSQVFINVLGVVKREIRPEILHRCAELIRRTSTLDVNGKDNFRLGISMNVKPDGPFFPFTYSSGNFGFSIALELTQEINRICNHFKSCDLKKLRSEILKAIIPQVSDIQYIADDIARRHGCSFLGFDFSLAPIIGTDGSVMTILNHLGIYDFGHTGTLFATGYLTNLLKHMASLFPSVGFSGVMYSLLEDQELCSIHNQRGITLEQLISLSTMCGCGVDMVPVYGGITNDEMMSIFLDVAGISNRLQKPLGVRLLPIPKCRRGAVQFTRFHSDADFLSNTKIVNLNSNLLTELGDSLDMLPVGNS